MRKSLNNNLSPSSFLVLFSGFRTYPEKEWPAAKKAVGPIKHPNAKWLATSPRGCYYSDGRRFLRYDSADFLPPCFLLPKTKSRTVKQGHRRVLRLICLLNHLVTFQETHFREMLHTMTLQNESPRACRRQRRQLSVTPNLRRALDSRVLAMTHLCNATICNAFANRDLGLIGIFPDFETLLKNL